ncbi:MAG: heavy-metal-associated domain-containing protein [Ruminococcaceae bacterium]|nr:heavy-metal-associated domain-containing protein [Oscillospiraceae bacterium]MBQ8325067.1 cation transporter [Clostridia bacterium]
MKKTYVMEDLDCAHCAAKMEEAIRKLEGVNSVTVSYIAQKFVLDAEDSRFDEILKEAVKICRKVEPDCRIIVK